MYRQSIRAKALDALRGLLPAASLSNVGIYGTGQSYEMLLLRMRAHPLPEARRYAELMLEELRKVIPSFLQRVDIPERGGVWTAVPGRHPARTDEVVAPPVARRARCAEGAGVGRQSGGLGPRRARTRSSRPCATPAPPCPTRRSCAGCGPSAPRTGGPSCGPTWGSGPTAATARAGPSSAPAYRFDVVSDYGAFRDLQRHRMLTIEWQDLGPALGYEMPDTVVARRASADRYERIDGALGRSLRGRVAERCPAQAPYAVALAFRIRYAMQMNAREAMHVLELRSGEQGHPAYRVVAQEMHRLIAEHAGHRLIAEAMTFRGPRALRPRAPRCREPRRGPSLRRRPDLTPTGPRCRQVSARKASASDQGGCAEVPGRTQRRFA